MTSTEQWTRFVSMALGDGEGPRFDQLCRLLLNEAKSDALLTQVRTRRELGELDERLIRQLVAHLIESGASLPDGLGSSPHRLESLHDRKEDGPMGLLTQDHDGGKPMLVHPDDAGDGGVPRG